MLFIHGRVANGQCRVPLSALSLALLWIGYFGTWVQHSAAALTMNAYDLSEWITRLPQVREGSLLVGRLHILALLALTIVLTTAWALRNRRRWWALGLSVLGFTMLLPGYPFFLWYRTDPEVRYQLVFAAATLVVAGMAGRLREARWSAVAWALSAITGMGLTSWSLLTVRPIVAELYGETPSIGWGWFAMNAGFALMMSVTVTRGLRYATRS